MTKADQQQSKKPKRKLKPIDIAIIILASIIILYFVMVVANAFLNPDSKSGIDRIQEDAVNDYYQNNTESIQDSADRFREGFEQ